MVIYFAKLVKKNSILFVFSGFSHTLLPMISPLSATAAASIAAAGGVGPAACGSPVASPGGSAAALVAAGAALAGSHHLIRVLVPIVTCSRVIRYESSCLPLRAGSDGLHVAQGGLAHPHRPVLTSTSAVVDIHIGRYRHRHRPVCIAPDGLHVAARGGGASIGLRPFSCVPQPLRGRHNCLCRGKKSAFCLVLSPTWTTFAPY